jgi:hypothetical protein
MLCYLVDKLLFIDLLVFPIKTMLRIIFLCESCRDIIDYMPNFLAWK